MIVIPVYIDMNGDYIVIKIHKGGCSKWKKRVKGREVKRPRVTYTQEVL